MRLIFEVLRLFPATLFAAFSLPSVLAGAVSLEPPTIIGIDPAPGFVEKLTSVSVTFSEPVTGVAAADFLINGVPAERVFGSAATYTFYFSQPPFGPVDITWGTLHTIADLDDPPQRFDGGGSGATWAYQLIDPAGPSVTRVLPPPGAVLRYLSEVEVSFNRPVTGIDASDLRLNGAGATNVVGVGAGPYRFHFPHAGAGPAVLEWAAGHGIATDEAVSVPFSGWLWSYAVEPGQPAREVVINEILAENQSGLLDEDKDPEDWIELYNRGSEPVNLGGWSLSVDREEEGQWVFPPTILAGRSYLLVWASGKDRREPAAGQRYHTNFKLNPTGDTLRLYGPELPRALVDEIDYPEQSPDHSYGRQAESAGPVWSYFAQATPGTPNTLSSIIGKVADVHFSVRRGFFSVPFSLTLACVTPGAEIRYTFDGSPPTPTNGWVYTEPISIATTRVVRAAAFASNRLPSPVGTHTYLMNLPNNRRLLPVLSLVTATNNLYGRTGIMEYNPRNTTKHGAAWERPVSAEWIRPEDNDGFQINAGLRVAGGDYIRARYNYRVSTPPEGKYSFRLYFRGEYGPGRLKYPVFPNSTLDSYDTLHLRAGMNDPTNPFLKDQFVRELSLDVGIPACHGTFVYLFLNGVYKGLYNPCERVNEDFLQAYLGGGDRWDVIGPGNAALSGDTTAWSQLRTAVRKDLTVRTNYLDVSARMDLTNFVDYLLPLIWADNDDWPHNNTRAAREKVAGSLFRFYPWDAEFSFTGHSVSYDTIANTLSSMSPPWGTTDYQAMFNSLKKSYEFRLLFADRVHRAFYNDGPLTDARLRARYNQVKAQVAPSIPGFNDVVGTWINGRRRYLTNIFAKAGFLASSNAPVASPFGGLVQSGSLLTLRNLAGTILYTTNGTDPREPFTSVPSKDALEYREPMVLVRPVHLKARSLEGTNWSALIDLAFEVTQVGSPLRITEIMFNPPGGDAFEYLELQNTGELPIDLSGCSLDGVQFRFPTPFPELAAGARLVLASDERPADFQQRYPNLGVAGWFAGALNNLGETVEVLDPSGRRMTSVQYSSESPWPAEANGAGSSLEMIDVHGDPNDPANWQPSLPGGSPGAPNRSPTPPRIRINELNAGAERDWIELYNPGPAAIVLDGWSITDNSNPRQLVFAPGTTIAAGGFVRIECREGASGPGLIAPFQLSRQGETLSLFDESTNRVDAVRYGPVIDGKTFGLVEDRWTLCDPTPLAPNQPASLGPLSDVKLNEFLANPEGGEDWLELHNLGEQPVALQGCVIVTSNALARIASPTCIEAHGFLALWADGNFGPSHLALKLPAGGGMIRFLDPNGQELDQVTYGPQQAETTAGRLPDGTGAFQALPFSASRGASNYLAQMGTGLRIAELLVRASPGPAWVELQNGSATNAVLAGFTFGVKTPGGALARCPFRADSRLSPGERMLLYFGTLPPGFTPTPSSQSFPLSLPEEGAVLTLRDPLDRVVDRVEYGPQVTNRSVGRADQRWVLLSTPTPGTANSGLAPLDAGDGLRLNEWLAAGGTNDFVELYNPAALPVSLENWVLTDDPSIYGSTNRRIAPLTFIEGGGFVRFHADDAPELGPTHLAFRLDRLGETIRLLNPSGFVVDTIGFAVQLEGVSEGRYPDGALDLVAFPGSASPGAANYLAPADADQDGMADDWERAYGLDPASPADAGLDPDNDGMTNWQEFMSGTNPRDSSSVFRLAISVESANELRLRFTAQPGLAYQLEVAESLSPPAWEPLAAIPAEPTAREVIATDPRPVEPQHARFYRAVLSP